MYLPSMIPYQQHRGFSRTFTPGHLSLGLFFPLEAFGGDIPSMLNQVALAKRAEELGFCALWFRDVPLRDPNFGDVGQAFDPWVYMGYMAAHTSEIALGSASLPSLYTILCTRPRRQPASITVERRSLDSGRSLRRSPSGVFSL